MKQISPHKLQFTWLVAATALALSSAYLRADYQATVQADHPLGYWRLDDSGTTAANLGSLGATGNGTYSGTCYHGRAGALVGDADTAVGLDGSSGYLQVPYNANLNSNTFTVEAWASPYQQNPGNYLGVLGAKINSPQKGFIFYLPPNSTQAQWSFWTGSGTAWNSQYGAVATGSDWAHLVGTYDGTNQCFYVNGALYARSKVTFVPNPSGALQIGLNGTTSYYFKSNIDEVAIYGYALPANRVLDHYVAARGSNPPPVAPLILAGPQSQTSFVGPAATFSVIASGSLPFTNQWFFLGSNTTGPGTNVFTSTNNTFTIGSVALTNAGNYQVIVANNGGSVTSSVVTLTVQDIQYPSIAPQPQPQTLYAGGTAHFIAGATGGGSLAYQWLFYNTNLPAATNASLIITNVQPANEGYYQLQVTNEAGLNVSDLVSLTVLPAPATNTYPGYVMADQPVAYWRLDESNGSAVALDLAGGFNGGYDGGVQLEQPGALSGDADTAALFGYGSTVVDMPFNATLNPSQFTLECWASDNALVTNDYRSVLTSRQDSPQQGFSLYAAANNHWQLYAGNGSTWSVVSGPAVQFNAWTHVVATYDGTTMRLYVNGTLVGNTVASYLPNPLNDFKIGAGGGTGLSYFFFGDLDEVAVYNTALSADRVAAHYAVGLGATTPPAIVVPPASGTALSGSNLTLYVQASGSLPLSYQWQFYSTNLSGQTATALPINGVGAANSGPYRVIVSNPAGSVTSSVAVVTAVALTNSYASVVLADEPAGYWRLDETNGSTTAFNLGSLGAAADGTYTNITLELPGIIPGDSCAGFTATNGSTADIPFASQLNASAFTAECWARMTGPGNATDEGYESPLTSRDGTAAGYMFYGLYGDTWQFWTGTGGGTFDKLVGPAIQLGSWTHLAATYDGTTKRFYVNGVAVGSSTAPFVPDPATVLRIGGGKTESTPGAYFFQGSVDEVAVYPNALAAASIQAHYAIGAPVPTLSIQRTATTILLNWSGGTLQQATTVPGTWSDVITNSPLDLGATPPGRMFYRVKR